MGFPYFLKSFNTKGYIMKTVQHFILSNDLVGGDLITNGGHTWKIEPKKNGGYYLKNIYNEYGPHISESVCGIVCIPNLSIAPVEVDECLWAVKQKKLDPIVVWATSEQDISDKYKDIENMRKLPRSRKIIKYKDGKKLILEDSYGDPNPTSLDSFNSDNDDNDGFDYDDAY
jgi:hypothetical protein